MTWGKHHGALPDPAEPGSCRDGTINQAVVVYQRGCVMARLHEPIGDCLSDFAHRLVVVGGGETAYNGAGIGRADRPG